MGVRILTQFLGAFGSFKTLHGQGAATQTKRRFNGFSEALLSVSGATKTVNANIDVVTECFVQRGWFFERCFVSVDAPVEVALLDQLAEQFCMGSLASPHNRAPHRHAVAFHAPKDIVDNLLNRPACHFFTTGRAVGFSNSGPKKTKIILDFRDRCHG